MSRSLVASLTMIMALGLVAAGCSKGSSSSGSASTAAPVSSGAIGSVASRDGGGYAWTSSISLNLTSGGSVDAIAVVESVVLATANPTAEVAELSIASVQTTTLTALGTGFIFQPTSLAVVGSSAYAGATDLTFDGAGDIYLRQGTLWTRVVDGNQRSMVVATLSGEIYGFGGSPEEASTVHNLPVGGTWQSRSDLFPNDCLPTVAIPHYGEMWVGAGPSTPSGPACLFRGNYANGFQQIALPFSVNNPATVQKVTALLSTSGGIVVAVGEYDLATNAVQNGSLWLNGYNGFELIESFSQDAPISLAFQDGTVYAGTETGRLVYRDPRGQMIDEPNLPRSQGVTALASKDSGILVLGLRTANGAKVVARIGNSYTNINSGGTGGTGTGGTGGTSYLATVKPLLQASCVGCHATMATGYTLSSGLSDDTADFNATLGQVDTANPSASQLLAKASGDVAHAGGALWASGSSQYDAVLQWIRDGAAFDGGSASTATTTPASTVPSDPTYLVDIKPIMASCAGCHSGLGDMPLSAGLTDDMGDYMSIVNETSTNNPAGSNLLVNATGGDGHPVALFTVGSTNYDTILTWIQKGTKYQ